MLVAHTSNLSDTHYQWNNKALATENGQMGDDVHKAGNVYKNT